MSRTWKLFICIVIAISISMSCLACWLPSSTITVVECISSYFVSAVSFIFWLLFQGSAYILVLLIKTSQITSQGLQFALKYVSDGLRGLAVSILNELVKTVCSTAAAIGHYLKEVISKISSKSHIIFDAAMDRAIECIKSLQKIVPVIWRNMAESVLKLLEGLWNNYVEALRFALRKGPQVN